MIQYEEKTLFVDGTKTSYFDEGSNEEYVVLFLHGWGESKEVFDGIIKKLNPHFRVILLDLPGHGGTEPLKEGSLGNYADFVKDFVSALELRKVNMVGFSMGGAISLMCSTMFPELVDKVVVWESSVHFRGIKRLKPIILLFKILRRNPSWRKRLYSAINNEYVVSLLSTIITPAKLKSLRTADDGALIDVGLDLFNSDLRGRVGGNLKDALLITGTRPDISVPKRKMKEVNELLPNAIAKDVKGAQHFSRDFSKVYDEILKFLQNNNEKT